MPDMASMSLAVAVVLCTKSLKMASVLLKEEKFATNWYNTLCI